MVLHDNCSFNKVLFLGGFHIALCSLLSALVPQNIDHCCPINVLLFFWVVLDIHDLSLFHRNFRVSISLSIKRPALNLIGGSNESINKFKETQSL
jgi:hypothetical protein